MEEEEEGGSVVLTMNYKVSPVFDAVQEGAPRRPVLLVHVVERQRLARVSDVDQVAVLRGQVVGRVGAGALLGWYVVVALHDVRTGRKSEEEK